MIKKSTSIILIHFLIGAHLMQAQQETAPNTQKSGTFPVMKSELPLAKTRYVDPKGFFSIIPPALWQVKEYPDDPRGKAAFLGPEANIDLRILINAVPFSTIEELLVFCHDIEKRMGIEMNISTGTINEGPAVQRSFSFKGLKFLYIDFLVGQVDHNLAYGAPLDKYDRYFPVVLRSIETYEPLFKEITDDQIRQHALAKKNSFGKTHDSNGKS